MTAYYNENDRKAAAWLRELIAAGLIAPGDVDERSIEDVRPADLAGYRQCHFFAGIGGWSYALRLAGWADDRPVWTGSCPCQPFSSANRGRARAGLDLWPVWQVLVNAMRPRWIFGEQVPDKPWADRLCDDVEAMGYSIGAAILPAYCVEADHARERFYFACHTDSYREPIGPLNAEAPWVQRARGFAESMAEKDGISDRVALRGYGNAIVPQVAAEFVRAWLDTEASQ